jgi:preprotein translocase, secY subunit
VLSAFGRVIKTADLRRKLLFTLGMIVLYRMGTFIPAPGISYGTVQQCLNANQTHGGAYDIINLFSGGALLQLSIFALGVMPYITASIIIQLLRVVIPRFQELHDEGAQGQAKLTQYTRYLTIALALLNATTIVSMARSGVLLGNCPGIIPQDDVLHILVIIITLCAGTGVIMWMGEQITERGVGNGMSLLIFTSIASSFPNALGSILEQQGPFVFWSVCLVGLAVMLAVVYVEQSVRRVPVQYAKRMIGRRTIGGTSTYIPLKVNMAGVIPIIFASSLLTLPGIIAQFNTPQGGAAPPEWVNWVNTYLTRGDHPLYIALYFLLILGFTYFYVAVTFDPVEVADNMKKYGGFIPGVRAGKPTERYLSYVLTRITLPGSLYLAVVSMIPLVALVLFNANQNFPFGGASLLIVVGVGLDTLKQVSAQLQQRNYEGLLR